MLYRIRGIVSVLQNQQGTLSNHLDTLPCLLRFPASRFQLVCSLFFTWVFPTTGTELDNSVMAKNLSSAAAFLDSHSKRDTVVRTVQFGTLFLGGLSRNRWPVLSEKLMVVCGEFSHARLILRMIDDIPMLAYTLKCYLSREVRLHTWRYSLYQELIICETPNIIP